MNRRDFLRRAAMLAGQLTVDPEFLLWTPKPMVTVPGLVGVDWGAKDATVIWHQLGTVPASAEWIRERLLQRNEILDALVFREVNPPLVRRRV